MAALDFPPSPLINDKYPVPAVPGVPQYTFDGVKWTTVGPQITNAKAADALPLMDAASAAIGTATDYAREDHVHPSDTSRAAKSYVDASMVRYDAAQTTTEAQKTQARQNIYAAPMDALSYSGMQINGSMDVSQERGFVSTPVSAAALWIVDGWLVSSIGGQALTASPSGTSAVSGFSRVLQIAVTTANAAPAASNYVMISQRIEGYRVQRLGWGGANAQPLTLAFWAYAVRPGTYSGSVQNGASNRSYPFSFTINAASTYEYKTITIPGDTTGTWLKDSNLGMQLNFAMMAGTSFCATAGAWAAGNFLGATGTINGVAATTDLFRIVGVVILPGDEAPSAERSPLIMRPFDQELVTCQRYWRKNPAAFGAWSGTVTDFRAALTLSPPMRAVPSYALLIGTSAIERIGVTFLNITGITGVTWNEPGGGQIALATGTSVAREPGVLAPNVLSIDARL